MSQQDFVSNIKSIPYPQAAVYAKLSDLNNLQQIKDRFNDPAFASKIQEEADKQHLGDIKSRLDNVTFNTDSVSFSGSPMGNVCLSIIEREAPKCIKLEGQKTPVPITMWIQLIPDGDSACKMRLTLRAELNLFIRGMVSKPLKEGIERIADMLAQLPYSD